MPPGYPDAFGDAAKFVVAPFTCDALAEAVGGEVRNQIRNANPTEAKKKVPRNSHGVVVNTVNSSISVTPHLGFTGFELFVKDPDVPSVTYTVSEFVQKRPLTLIPIQTLSVTGTAHLDATLKTGDVTINFGSAWKLRSDAGGHFFGDFDRLDGSLEIRW